MRERKRTAPPPEQRWNHPQGHEHPPRQGLERSRKVPFLPAAETLPLQGAVRCFMITQTNVALGGLAPISDLTFKTVDGNISTDNGR